MTWQSFQSPWRPNKSENTLYPYKGRNVRVRYRRAVGNVTVRYLASAQSA